MSLILCIGMLLAFSAPETSSIAKANVRIIHFALLDVSEEKNLSGHTVAAQLRLMMLDPRTLSPEAPRFGDAVSLSVRKDPSDRELTYALACSEEHARTEKLKAEIYGEALRRVQEAARVVAKKNRYSAVVLCRPESVDINFSDWSLPEGLRGVALPEVAFVDLQSAVECTRSVVAELKEMRKR